VGVLAERPPLPDPKPGEETVEINLVPQLWSAYVFRNLSLVAASASRRVFIVVT